MRLSRLRTSALLIGLCALGLGCEPEEPESGGEGGSGGIVGAGGEGGAGAAGGEGGVGAAGGEGGAGAVGGVGGEGGAGAAGGVGGAGAAGGEGGAGAAGGEGGAGAAGGEGGAGAAGGQGGAGGECQDVPSLAPDNPMYDRYEGIGFDNACRTDDDCFLGGCSQEVCSASPEVASTCEVVPIPDGGCGCVQGECIWHIEECGPCTDTDGDGICNADDRVCGPNEVACDAEPPACRGGVPEARDGCWTGRCVTWDECGEEPPCPDTDDDGICDDEDRVCGPNEVLCDAIPPECGRGTVPEADGGCWTGRCVTWAQCGADPEPQACGGIAGLRCRDANQVCVDDPRDDCNPERGADCGGICVDEERLCTPVRQGEFGECEAIIGYAMSERGVCAAVSGCECDANCAGRVFPTREACAAQCAGPMCESDADNDEICDADDPACNADGTLLRCRIPAPACRERGTVPEIREGCYTGECVTWEECGAPACPDADGDGVCDANDSDCNADGTPLMCRRAPPECRERGTVPEVREGCYTDRCVTWEECGGPVVEACAPIEPGEFGFCRAIIGWGIEAGSGQCGLISGCGCDERCEGRVFESQRECQAACEEAEPEPQMCGGFAGIRCAERGQTCVDDPRDNCAPPRGADCSGVCIDDERVCTPVRQGEFGDCEAIIGWAQGERGCIQVSGCGCDIDCAGRVFGDQRSCEAACNAGE